MEDVERSAFSSSLVKTKADLMYTEFISSEGLIQVMQSRAGKLDIFEYEKPIGIQIFGGDKYSPKMAAKLGMLPTRLPILIMLSCKKVALAIRN